MIRILIILLFLLNISPVFAQDEDMLCHFWVEHEPGLDVAYRPGVDIHGKAVVPADLNVAPTPIPDVIHIPISIDLAGRLNQPLPQGTEMDAPVGLAEIYSDGRVLYNGQDVSGTVASLCGEVGQEPESLEKKEDK